MTRAKQQPVDLRPRAVGTKTHPVLRAHREAAERMVALVEFFHDQLIGRRRFDAVHLVSEDVEYLAAARRPLRGRIDPAAVEEDQRILQRVRSDLFKIVIRSVPVGSDVGNGIRGEPQSKG